MKLQIKILAISMSLILGTMGMIAQNNQTNAQQGQKNAQKDHELSIYGGGGLSTLLYKATAGDTKLGLGGHFGLGYNYFFSPKWGIGTGLELAFYNSSFKMGNMNFSYLTKDKESMDFEFRSKASDLKEKQNAMLLQIPLMLQFQTDKKHPFFIAAGGKFGIPLSGKFKTTCSLSNSGYYEHENSLYDTQEFMGFGNFKGKKAKGGLDYKLAFLVSLEAGKKWRFNNKWSLYTGAYADYGLNNIKEKKQNPNIVEYNRTNPAAFAVNTVIHSQYSQSINAQPKAFTDKLNPLAVGVKLRLAFGKNGREKKPEPAPTPIKTEEPKKEQPQQPKEEKPVVVEKKPEPVMETPKVVEKEKPDNTDAINAAKKQIEQPIDDYALSQKDVANYQQKQLDEKITLLKKYPDLRFHIYGHTCDKGTKEVNDRVGLDRAAKVKTYMISKGIDEKRIISVASKRDTMPLVPNTNDDNRKKNRRVQIVIQ